jgi:hypothetical protein
MGRDSQRKASIRKPAHLPARDRNSIDRDHTSHLITALRRSSPCTPSVEPERDGSPRKPSELLAPEREARDRLAVELHLNGYTYSEIAGTLGVANKSVAYKMVQRGLNSAPESSSEQLGLELLRLEFLLDELERRLELEDPAGPGYWSYQSRPLPDGFETTSPRVSRPLTTSILSRSDPEKSTQGRLSTLRTGPCVPAAAPRDPPDGPPEDRPAAITRPSVLEKVG